MRKMRFARVVIAVMGLCSLLSACSDSSPTNDELSDFATSTTEEHTDSYSTYVRLNEGSGMPPLTPPEVESRASELCFDEFTAASVEVSGDGVDSLIVMAYCPQYAKR